MRILRALLNFLGVILSLLIILAVLLAFLPYIGYIFSMAKWRRWRALRIVRAELRKAGLREDEIKKLENIVVPRYPGLGGVLRWLTLKR